jgi:hypothetical protein
MNFVAETPAYPAPTTTIFCFAIDNPLLLNDNDCTIIIN